MDMCLNFFTNISENILTLRRTERDMIKNAQTSSFKIPFIDKTLIFSMRFQRILQYEI